MTPKLVLLSAVALYLLVPSARANPQLAQQQCGACHAVDSKKMGPSFKQIAGQYKGKPSAEADLRARLRSGQGHPAIKTGEADLNSILQWILTL
jgi:cytochrome c